jgi:hypothetical protein
MMGFALPGNIFILARPSRAVNQKPASSFEVQTIARKKSRLAAGKKATGVQYAMKSRRVFRACGIVDPKPVRSGEFRSREVRI